MDKLCSRCQEEKPLSEFNKKKRSRVGYRPECRECQSKTSKLYLADPEKRKMNNLRQKLYKQAIRGG